MNCNNMDCNSNEPQYEQDDLVSLENACPRCGERRTDYLIWIDDESEEVECSTCGMVYKP
jgi:DNA-directed RNA polymerase subunit RPC12/RpoP